MSKKTIPSVTAIIFCLGMFFVASASAQSPADSTLRDSTSQHHRMLYRMMKDMTDQMGQMTEQ